MSLEFHNTTLKIVEEKLINELIKRNRDAELKRQNSALRASIAELKRRLEDNS